MICKICGFIGEKILFNGRFCLPCKKIALNERYLKIKDTSSYINKKKEIAARYRIKNKLKITKHNKIYYKNNKDQFVKYIEKNKERFKINRRKYKKNKYNDIFYKINHCISNSIRKMLKSNKSYKSTKKYLPFTTQELKHHLEYLFEPWMNWSNQGIYCKSKWNDQDLTTWKWQLDHIVPHSFFKYTSMEDQQFKDCWSLSNLRPLNAKQNLLKSDKIL